MQSLVKSIAYVKIQENSAVLAYLEVQYFLTDIRISDKD